ncbi:hypothetical protein GRX03_04930 [Halovenus sp. WSH3]|uniref:Uncharacterized protein n=1 Tax=Halovenus carboxidivorans TaxID=2692199 RepID=A0A6B0T6Q1_9EURY|nr:DUF5796 family protein [Halovenus carboxidivorans]MXR50952.1 hypothetical protein [Halovenus carboxidivorans]
MSDFREVPPDTLSVDLVEEGVVVEYTDGREVLYRGVPERVESPHETAPGKDTHVLVVDESETSGVLLYVNERRTDAEILEGTGVGRVLLEAGEETTLFPGVIVRGGNLRSEIVVEPDLSGRVFVFEEDQFSEHSYELLPAE